MRYIHLHKLHLCQNNVIKFIQKFQNVIFSPLAQPAARKLLKLVKITFIWLSSKKLFSSHFFQRAFYLITCRNIYIRVQKDGTHKKWLILIYIRYIFNAWKLKFHFIYFHNTYINFFVPLSRLRNFLLLLLSYSIFFFSCFIFPFAFVVVVFFILPTKATTSNL